MKQAGGLCSVADADREGGIKIVLAVGAESEMCLGLPHARHLCQRIGDHRRHVVEVLAVEPLALT